MNSIGQLETIKGIGKLNIQSNIKDGLGKRVANAFYQQLVVQFAKNSAKYIYGTEEAPFAYRERQLHSILAPAIADLTKGIYLMECPIEREWSIIKNEEWKNSLGWVDYWCRYRNYDFLIELKHNFNSYKKESIRKSIFDNWNYMNDKQLSVMDKEAIRFSEFSKGVILTGIHIITIYECSEESSSIERYEELLNIQHNFSNQLKPSWSGLWVLHRNLAEQCSWKKEKRNEYYPAVLFLVSLKDVINH